MAESTLLVTIELNPCIPHTPTERQREFLSLDCMEAFYGGAGGGGKSDALLMGALQYVTQPGYAALILRRTYQDLALPGALISRAHQWLDDTDARWSEMHKTWTFPSGAILQFGYLDNDSDLQRYRSAEFQYIGVDELTDFPKAWYAHLFSRLRRLEGSTLPLRMRAGGNPGGIGHSWVKADFIEGEKPFVPAKLQDNPFIDRAQYEAALERLPGVERERILNGDWDVNPEGNYFKRHWFEIVNDYPRDSQKVRFWDMAATKPKRGLDPDYTAGVLMAKYDGQVFIVDVRRERLSPQENEALVRQCAELDGREVLVVKEQEPGASGKADIDHYAREVLLGFPFKGKPSTGSKTVRAFAYSSAAQAGNIKLVRGSWNEAFLEEHELFDGGAHDDQVDAAAGAFNELTETIPFGIARL